MKTLLNLLKYIFLTKKEKEYLEVYQKKYHKLTLKEKICLIKIDREFNKKHKGMTEEEIIKELEKK